MATKRRPPAPDGWPRLRPDDSWASASIEERGRAIEAVCKSAMQLLANSPDRDARLRQTDPVPASTRAHLRRLASARDG